MNDDEKQDQYITKNDDYYDIDDIEFTSTD